MGLTNEEIQQVYEQARVALLISHPEWICTIEQNSLVIQLNWQNATYFNGRGVTHVARVYRHIVKVYPDGKFMTLDVHVNDENSIGLGGIVLSQDAFAGKSWNFHLEKELGHDNNTGETGILTYKFCTSDIQKPVKEYFEGQGFQYKFYSVGEGIKAIPPQIKIALGALFTFIGIAFAVVAYAVLYLDPYSEMTVTTNGVNQVIYAYQVPVIVKILTALFPAIFILVGVLLIINFVKHDVV